MNESPETPAIVFIKDSERVENKEEKLQEQKPESVLIVRGETLYTLIQLDLLNGEMMECQAIVDTGSVMSILSVGTELSNPRRPLAF